MTGLEEADLAPEVLDLRRGHRAAPRPRPPRRRAAPQLLFPRVRLLHEHVELRPHGAGEGADVVAPRGPWHAPLVPAYNAHVQAVVPAELRAVDLLRPSLMPDGPRLPKAYAPLRLALNRHLL